VSKSNDKFPQKGCRPCPNVNINSCGRKHDFFKWDLWGVYIRSWPSQHSTKYKIANFSCTRTSLNRRVYSKEENVKQKDFPKNMNFKFWIVTIKRYCNYLSCAVSFFYYQFCQKNNDPLTFCIPINKFQSLRPIVYSQYRTQTLSAFAIKMGTLMLSREYQWILHMKPSGKKTAYAQGLPQYKSLHKLFFFRRVSVETIRIKNSLCAIIYKISTPEKNV